MQTRTTNPDHHQKDSAKAGTAYFPPESELIALARSKGQVLAEHTLRRIREILELRGVSLAEFVADARPHFRNNILNPSGFLINRARNFSQLSRPARAYPARRAVEVTGETCPCCNGEKYVMNEHKIEPCAECSTSDFREEWNRKEAERAKKRQTSVGSTL